MEDNNLTMDMLMEEIDKTMTRIHTGDILEGKVVSVDSNGVIVNIGYHADGIIPNHEFSNDPSILPETVVSPGDVIDVEVLKVDDGEGNVLLSKKRAEAQVAWEDIEEAYNNKAVVEVTIAEVVKGGVIGYVKGIRAFIPASQLSDRYVEDMQAFVGEKVRTEIIEFDRGKRKLVLSARRLAKEEREAARKEMIASLREGDRKTGTVVKLMPFGAFVDIDGVQGLLHNQDLSWTRVKHPSEILKEGQQIEVTILNVDKENGKIGLGLKDITQDPWFIHTANLHKDSVVQGTVTRLADFGAFVQIADGVEGLVHISQISEKRITKPSEVLEEGQKVKVKILEINKQTKKISLSIKEAEDEFDSSMMQYSDSAEESLGTIGDVLGDAFKNLFK